MRRCFLHIGPHKTGTSSIQQTLHFELDDPDFEYARLGVANQGPMLMSLFSAEPERYSGHRRRGRTEAMVKAYNLEARQKLRQALRGSDVPNVIFSGEAISQMRQDGLEKLRDFLNRKFDEVTVIGYMRSPKAQIQSRFQQRIRSQPVSLELDRLYMGYRRIFGTFDEVFGAANCRFFKFAAELFPDGDVVRHFCEAVGLTPPAIIRRSNESLSAPAIQALYAYHHLLGEGDGRQFTPMNFKAAAEILSRLPGPRFRLASQLVDPVVAANAEDVAWAEARIGTTLADAPDKGDVAFATEADFLDIAARDLDALEELVAAHGGLPADRDVGAMWAAQLVASLLTAVRNGARVTRQGIAS